MSDSLKNLLSKKDFSAPPEISIIKDYVKKHFDDEVLVTVQPQQIIIGVKSASLAGALRIELHKLQELCKTDKRLTIRISS